MGGGHGHGVTYKGVTLHQPKRWHSVTGKGLCAVMWFWVLYRAKQDGPVVLENDATYEHWNTKTGAFLPLSSVISVASTSMT
ncbi:UNVERIFIED_CONTAM: NADH dehydrogenase [ubiquinone] 1 beta subcomplex subunit [Sesamum radiatum]|uniref:NADH dehydrogenase [ubiquinone] 1 beta subcomplex subunit n=1 Tax=Sesamum radiatum TaxID=300843 RepID=A0AAW2PY44_SESRA